MRDILVLSDDVVGRKMAGPGIRAWEMAKTLSRRFRVALAVPDFSPDGPESGFFRNAPFEVVFYSLASPSSVLNPAAESRIIVLQGYVLSKFPGIKKLERPIIADIYDPFVLENLFVHQTKISNLADRKAAHLRDLRVFNDLIHCADHFLCACSRQRDLITGSLMTLGRIHPGVLDTGPDLDDLISVVPFGLSKETSAGSGEEEVRARFPQIKDGDILLLWGGVLSNWFDPVSLLRALKKALVFNPRLKLLFLSTKHPNPLLPEFDMVKTALAEAKALGLKDDAVIFNDDWVEYDQRGAFFRRADIGVSVHMSHIETRYAFRTRMLDYLKYRLPVVCTEGDYFAELVKNEGLGLTAGPGDVSGLADAILALSENSGFREEIRKKMDAVADRFVWERVIEPLVRYCRGVLDGRIAPARFPDRKEIMIACSGIDHAEGRERIRRFLRPLDRRLPLKLSARIKRLVKF